jgi:broad specificity phosphatase PhoE
MRSNDGVCVGIYDATNSTRERRIHLKNTLEKESIGAKIMCLESICNDKALLDENIRTVKLNTPDYRDRDPEEAVADFLERREEYNKVYETLDNSDGPYIKIHDCQKFEINRIRGYLPLKIVHFVMNLHTLPRTFYFSRHGQSEYNQLGKIGGDSGLAPPGDAYAKRLAQFANEVVCENNRPARLWTSTLRRTKETAKYITHEEQICEFDGHKHKWIQLRPMARRNLDELYAGKCDGMTYAEIEEHMPDEFRERQLDKLSYRYPRGESYMDVTLRLEPLAHEMERTREPILIIAHQGVLRILYAYFMGLPRSEAPTVSIPLNTVIQITPHAYGCSEARECLLSRDEMRSDGQDEPITSMPVMSLESKLKEVSDHKKADVMNPSSH